MEITRKATGGGCMFIVNQTHCQSTLVSSHNGLFESLFITVKCQNKKFLVGNAYIPPSSDTALYTQLCNQLEELADTYPDHSIILLGDFNLAKINWISTKTENRTENQIITSECKLQKLIDGAKVLRNVVNGLGLVQNYPPHPAKGYTLDLVFSEPGSTTCTEATDPLIKTDQDHVSCMITVNFNASFSRQ